MASTLTSFSELLKKHYPVSGPPAEPEPWLVEHRRQLTLPVAERSTYHLRDRLWDAYSSDGSWVDTESARQYAAELLARGEPLSGGDAAHETLVEWLEREHAE